MITALNQNENRKLNMEKYIFRNREIPLDWILQRKDIPLVNVYGEAGIGKTRLLEQAESMIFEMSPKPLTLKLDFKDLKDVDGTENRKDKFLRSLVSQWEGGFGQVLAYKNDAAIAQITASLLNSPLLGSPSVYLIFDTTETLQEYSEFWAWLEECFIGQLIVYGENKIKFIFGGRMPAPFQRHEVRRVLKLVRLDPLSVEIEAKQLIGEILEKENSNIIQEEKKKTENFILGFSFGHPGLSVELAEYLGRKTPLQISEELEKEVCEKVVSKYIKDILLSGIERDWVKILELASILDYFDPYILKNYTEKMLPDIAKDKNEAFYNQGIASMRRKKNVIWSEQQGDRLHGVIREIIRRDIQVESKYLPDKKNLYQKANEAAAGIVGGLRQLAEAAGDSELAYYDDQIRIYQTRAEGE
jgi:hypothetical protein